MDPLAHRLPQQFDRIRGRQVWIDHGKGLVTRYAHLSSIAVSVGSEIAAGQLVGYSGDTGSLPSQITPGRRPCFRR